MKSKKKVGLQENVTFPLVQVKKVLKSKKSSMLKKLKKAGYMLQHKKLEKKILQHLIY